MTQVHGSCSLQVMGSWLLLLRLERKQKSSSSPFQIRIFLFLSYSFGVETINTFMHSRSSLKNDTQFQTKIKSSQTLKMTTALVVETSVTVNINSPIQDYVHLIKRSNSTFCNPRLALKKTVLTSFLTSCFQKHGAKNVM